MAQFGNEWRDYTGPVKADMKPVTVYNRTDSAVPTPARRSKYGATKTEIDGIVFASRKEANRYCALKMLEAVGQIRALRLQPEFPCWTSAGKGYTDKPIGAYRADFAYEQSYTVNGDLKWRGVVEDVKGFKTPLYRWKKKHVEAQYGITVVEV